jgi:hypothetical protein
MRKSLSVLLVTLFLTGCGGVIAGMYGIPIVDPQDASTVTERTTTDYNPHKDLTTVTGPVIFAQSNLGGHRYTLRAWKNGKGTNGIQSFQLYVVASLDGWYFLDRAYSNGKKLSLVRISQNVLSCASFRTECLVSETVGINLTKSEVAKLAKGPQNFELEISGNKGSITLSVPPAYFKGVLESQGKS